MTGEMEAGVELEAESRSIGETSTTGETDASRTGLQMCQSHSVVRYACIVMLPLF
jgi:hypothetical protein